MGVDRAMIELDGTQNKGRLGANAILGVSLAVARAAASAVELAALSLSRRPERAHPAGADDEHPQRRQARRGSSVDMQEFMVMPVGAPSFREGLRWGAEVFHALKKVLHERGAEHQRRRRRRLRAEPRVQRGGGRRHPRGDRKGGLQAGRGCRDRARPGRVPNSTRTASTTSTGERPDADRRRDGRLSGRLGREVPDHLDRRWAGRGRLGRAGRR